VEAMARSLARTTGLCMFDRITGSKRNQ